MDKLKITVLGNSVAVRTRPRVENSPLVHYGDHLHELLKDYSIEAEVVNLGKHRATILSAVGRIQEFIETDPDFYIINYGIVDAAIREIPLWYSDAIEREKKSIWDVVLAAVHGRIMKKNRPFFVRLRGNKPWVGQKDFEHAYESLLKGLKERSNSRIIVMSINIPDDRVEEQLPGSKQNVALYNEFIRSMVDKYELIFLDTTDLDSKSMYPDGVHYSFEGNAEIAKRLASIITKQIKTGA